MNRVLYSILPRALRCALTKSGIVSVGLSSPSASPSMRTNGTERYDPSEVVLTVLSSIILEEVISIANVKKS